MAADGNVSVSSRADRIMQVYHASTTTGSYSVSVSSRADRIMQAFPPITDIIIVNSFSILKSGSNNARAEKKAIEALAEGFQYPQERIE